MPLGIQHPDGHQGVMHLAPTQVNAAFFENAEVITLHCAAQRGGKGPLTALIRPLPALFHRHIELIGQEAGEIRGGKGLQLLVVIGFNGVHVAVRHLAGGVHRHLLKGDGSGPIDIVVFRLRDLVVAGAVCTGAVSLIMGIALRLAVEHPEGNIDPPNLLHMIFTGKAFRQEKLTFVVVLDVILKTLLIFFLFPSIVKLLL